MAIAQSRTPRIIDCHVHHNGDPAFLQKMLAKLDSVEGMAFLLTVHSSREEILPTQIRLDHTTLKSLLDIRAALLQTRGRYSPGEFVETIPVPI